MKEWTVETLDRYSGQCYTWMGRDIRPLGYRTLEECIILARDYLPSTVDWPENDVANTRIRNVRTKEVIPLAAL